MPSYLPALLFAFSLPLSWQGSPIWSRWLHLQAPFLHLQLPHALHSLRVAQQYLIQLLFSCIILQLGSSLSLQKLRTFPYRLIFLYQSIQSLAVGKNNNAFQMLVKDKLDGTNYLLCAYMTCHVMISKGMWNVVLGAEKRLTILAIVNASTNVDGDVDLVEDVDLHTFVHVACCNMCRAATPLEWQRYTST